MATNSSLTRSAVTGEILMGATGAAAPTGTAGATVGFAGLGYVSNDGVTVKPERSTDDQTAWQNGDTVRTLTKDSKLTVSFTLIETKKETVELYWGTTVSQSVSEGNYAIVPANTGGRRSFILDVVDGANLRRMYIPQGEVSEVGEQKFANGELIGHEVTITCYPDATISGCAKVWDTALKS